MYFLESNGVIRESIGPQMAEKQPLEIWVIALYKPKYEYWVRLSHFLTDFLKVDISETLGRMRVF